MDFQFEVFGTCINDCQRIYGHWIGYHFYYLAQDLPSVDERDYVAPISTWPAFFSITIFAIEAMGVVMPLENAMKTPQNFVGIFGVLNKGMGRVTLVYILLGFLGYLRYGTDTKGSITLKLPVEEVPAQIVKILISFAVFYTFGLQFFVCVEIVWNGIKDKFTKRYTVVNSVMRTVPTFSSLIGLIGAFCFSISGLLVPIAIEFVTYWDKGFGKYNWMIWKNVIISIYGVLALIFGFKSAIEEIVELCTKDPVVQQVVAAINATTPN